MITGLFKDDETQQTDSTSSAGSIGFLTRSSITSHSMFSLKLQPKSIEELEKWLEKWLCLAASSEADLRESIFKTIAQFLKKNPKLVNYVSKTLNANALELATRLNQSASLQKELFDLNCRIRPEVLTLQNNLFAQPTQEARSYSPRLKF